MRYYIFKLLAIIVLLIFVVISTLKIYISTNLKYKEARIYSSNQNIPTEVINNTSFVEIVYGSIYNLTINQDSISFNVKSKEDNIDEFITINKSDPIINIFYGFETSKEIIDNRKEQILNSDISENLKYIYLSDKTQVSYEFIEQVIQEDNTIYVSFLYPTIDSNDYIIGSITYYGY